MPTKKGKMPIIGINIFKFCVFLLPMLGINASAYAASTQSAFMDYNGNYKGRTVISKYLANFCEIPDDTIVGKVDVLKSCMDKLARKMNDKDPMIAEEGKKDWSRIMADTWTMAKTQSGTMLNNIENYEEEYQTLWQSTNASGGDTHMDQAKMDNAQEKQMRPFNGLLTMHAEKNKAVAINNL